MKKIIEQMATQYNSYATVKMCMNYFTMKEIMEEYEDKKADVCVLFDNVRKIIKDAILKDSNDLDADIELIDSIRENIEFKMHNLTAYADAYEIYEYVLNRIEAAILDKNVEVDIEDLQARMMQYVFSENDAIVINSKLQLIISQLPVRMTKNKLFDIISSTLLIYQGGERRSLDEFVEMIRTATLIKKPEGFTTEYPFLYKVYKSFSEMDFKDVSLEQFEELTSTLEMATTIINTEVSNYMLLQEIVNDTYAILVSSKQSKNITDKRYMAAIKILEETVNAKELDAVTESLFSTFVQLEGAQERLYEEMMALESRVESFRSNNEEEIESLGLSQQMKELAVVEKLLSSSIFVSLTDISDEEKMEVDSKYLNDVKEKLLEDIKELLQDSNLKIKRSIMSKILSVMPIFLNSKQEIQSYFAYVLEHCNDDSELISCKEIIDEIIEDER